MPKVNEAGTVYMTKQEQKLKRKLIALLRDDGHGHKHAKYAARLEDFIIHIVSRKEDPNMTAAISWEDVTIFISEGFLIVGGATPEQRAKEQDWNMIQLNVLMRHELAHHLMCHQVRMTKTITDKYGPEGATRISMSHSLHDIINIIEDFEISNKRYTEEDKNTVRNMMLNGRMISGLVTEDSRQDWMDLPLEQMFEKIVQEIDALHKSILARWDALDMNQIGKPRDFIHGSIKADLFVYRDINHPTNFFHTLDQFIANRGLYHFVPLDIFDHASGQLIRPAIVKYSSLVMPDGSESPYQTIIKKIAGEFTETNGYVKQDLRDRVLEIAKTNPTIPYELKGNSGTIETLYTPEEKFIAIDCLKARIPELEEYNTWYGKVQKTLSDPKYSDQDLDDILAAVEE